MDPHLFPFQTLPDAHVAVHKGGAKPAPRATLG